MAADRTAPEGSESAGAATESTATGDASATSSDRAGGSIGFADIDHDLHETLVKTVQDVAAAAVIDVRFELKGSRVGAVQVGAGPAAYQRMLKRAVRSLQCESSDAAPQQVAFRVRFVDPFARSTAASASALTLLPASAPSR